MNKFAIISPTAYLEEFSTRSTYHLALAHLVASDEKYAEFYRACSDAGDWVVLDNSVFEFGTAWDPSKLVDLALKIKAKTLVLPDYPNQHQDVTIEAAIKYIPIYKAAGLKCFYVPQSLKGDWDGFCQGFLWGAMEPSISVIGCSILGFPNALNYLNPAIARVVGAQRLLDVGHIFKARANGKIFHWLGLLNTSIELPNLIRMGVLDYCDSSNPIWAASNGYSYDTNSDSYLFPTKKLLPHVDFNWQAPTSMLPSFIKRAHHNLDIVQSIFEHPYDHR